MEIGLETHAILPASDFFYLHSYRLPQPNSCELKRIPTWWHTTTIWKNGESGGRILLYVGTQRGGPNFHAFWSEFEYGATAWWTTELYLSGQTTFGDSTVFTGYRWENRVRPLKNEHWINPVLYVEFEDINGADKILKEVVGHDVESDFVTPNAEARREKKREAELKLILSSNYKGWNFTENTIAEKNLTNSPWEFGYALGASRPLTLKGAAQKCNFCLQHFIAGVEMYGGLGDRYSFGLHNTSHYLAPGLAWNLPSGWTFKIEPSFGLNDNSHQFFAAMGRVV